MFGLVGYLISAGVLVAGLLTAYTYVHHEGYEEGINDEKTSWNASEQARLHDDIRRSDNLAADVEAIRKEKDDEIASINTKYLAQLDGLRQRPDTRVSATDTARTRCTGATGRELSRPDATFLAGLAARADTQRTALAACYQEIDKIRLSLTPAK